MQRRKTAGLQTRNLEDKHRSMAIVSEQSVEGQNAQSKFQSNSVKATLNYRGMKQSKREIFNERIK